MAPRQFLQSNLQQLAERLRAHIHELPSVLAEEAVNFFKESFDYQGFQSLPRRRWPDRKRHPRYGAGRGQGRAILVVSGRLRRSIRVERLTRLGFVIATDVPYARAHNEGFRGTVQVRGHVRRSKRKVRDSYMDRTGRQRKRRKLVAGPAVQVAPHARKMNLPQRRFMGASPILTRRLVRSALRMLQE